MLCVRRRRLSIGHFRFWAFALKRPPQLSWATRSRVIWSHTASIGFGPCMRTDLEREGQDGRLVGCSIGSIAYVCLVGSVDWGEVSVGYIVGYVTLVDSNRSWNTLVS